MTDHNIMTIDQCRDEVGKLKGWTVEGWPKWKGPLWFPPDWPDCNESMRSDHPFEPTTDAALAAMPKGWDWVLRQDGDAGVFGSAWNNGPEFDVETVPNSETATTVWRLCLAAWRKEKGNAAAGAVLDAREGK